MKQIKVMTVFGTRPEAVKMAPLVHELDNTDGIDSIVCVTAQHRHMLDQVLEIFHIVPDVDLNIMQDRQTLKDITIRALDGLFDAFAKHKPDIVLVHGDTSTTFVASLAAFYNQIAVGHVEAGLRTYDKYAPYPEEMNRKLTGSLADLHFAPTISNRDNLLREAVPADHIFVTGNTVIDALSSTVREGYVFEDTFLKQYDFTGKRVILVTAHRRENLGEPLENICKAIYAIAEKYADVEFIYPVHLNPAVKSVADRILGSHKQVHLISPLHVTDMHNLMARVAMVMTDSGGLQEEAPSLGKPVLVLRNETERPEAVTAGTVRMAGTDFNNIVNEADLLLKNDLRYMQMAKAVNPYGDGHACRRIVEALLFHFDMRVERPVDFVPIDNRGE